MPSAGSRAFFLAPRPHLATRACLRSNLLPAGAHVQGRRAFRSSTHALQARPDGVNTPDQTTTDDNATKEDTPSAQKAETQSDDGPAADAEPAPAPVAEGQKKGQKETVRTTGYGSARARASRHSKVEEMPPFKVPPWFRDEYVSLYEWRRPTRKGNELFPLGEEDRHSLLRFLDLPFSRFQEKMTSSRLQSQAHKEQYYLLYTPPNWPYFPPPHGGPKEKSSAALRDFMALERLGAEVCSAAGYSVLALAYNHGGPPDSLGKIREICRLVEPSVTLLTALLPWCESRALAKSLRHKITPDALRWLSSIRLDEGPDAARLYASSIAERRGREYMASVEIVATLRAEMDAQSASIPKDAQRPVPVISIVGRTSSRFAQSVVNDVASELEADVLHFDAHTISLLLAQYVGQGPHLGSGSISSLGYGAAEMNGRLITAKEPEAEIHEKTITVSLPPKIRSMVSKQMNYTSPDDRWDDLKLNNAFSRLLETVDAKRARSTASSECGPRPLMVHLHNYVEIGSLNYAVIRKLRNAVDGLRGKGKQVVLVGSSSSDAKITDMFRSQLVEMGADDGHVIPFSANLGGDKPDLERAERNEAERVPLPAAMHGEEPGSEQVENMRENITNLVAMMDAMTGKPCELSEMGTWLEFVWRTSPYSRLSDATRQALWRGVYDGSFIKRMATMILGLRSKWHETRSVDEEVSCAFDIHVRRVKEAEELHAGMRPPYYLFPSSSPTSQSSSGSEELAFGQSAAASSSSSSSSSSSQKGYDQYEKKLLPGLVDPKDIHTTVDDVILAPETKESIFSLTSLSITRPEAFSYGVLKAERIPGCLLYGPPGTGKTLLAKAVAKQSGASMIEVSAASINDMYVGQSEKNVRALFSLARKLKPAVIFIDEADALLSARGGRWGRTSHREVMTQFLREWDGMQDMGSFIMVATNRPYDLDEAVLRRLPRRILIDLPLRTQREQILRRLLRDEHVDPAVDLGRLAVQTELYSGSDLKNVCVAAAMQAVRDEVQLQAAHEGSEPFVFPERRVLTADHFAHGLRDISASISEDMSSLKAIRTFDERYGDAGRKRKGPRNMGFEVGPEVALSTEEACVRKGEPLPA